MSLWGRAFAALYDPFMARTEAAGLGERRRDLLSQARGRVLEVGAGTGVNLAHYPSGLDTLALTEPEAPMARRLREQVRRRGVRATVHEAPATALPFPDASFDVAVATLVLCTVDDPAAALRELRRVLRADGRLLFLEHVRSDDPGLARWQDRLQPAWRRLGHGCRCNRDTEATIGAGPFVLEAVEHGRVPLGAPIIRPLISGVARAA